VALLKLIYLALCTITIFSISSSLAQLISVTETPSQGSFQTGINQTIPVTETATQQAYLAGANQTTPVTPATINPTTGENASALNEPGLENLSEMENVQIVRRQFMLFSSGDIPAIFNAMAEDVEWVQPGTPYVPYAGDYVGLDQVKGFFMKQNELIEFTQLDTREFLPEGDKVVVLGHYKAIAKPTGRSYESEFAQVITFRDGKIVKIQSFDDTVTAAAAFSQMNQTI
jgi:ketosteroid isomerase-like protein